MAIAQINARIAVDLKREGDSVLARNGVSVTEAIRLLWNYLATSKRLPDFMVSDQTSALSGPTAQRHAEQVARQGAGLAVRLADERGISTTGIQELSYQDLRDFAFEELLEERQSHA